MESGGFGESNKAAFFWFFNKKVYLCGNPCIILLDT